MLRIGLAAYLALSTAIGSSLCCCLPGDVLGVCTSAKDSSVSLRCCDHHDKHHDSQRSMACHFPIRQNRGQGKDCPCKRRNSEPVKLTPSKTTFAADSSRSLVLPHKMTVDTSALGMRALAFHGQGPARERCVSFPYCDPRGILRALQIMRC
jgi:hypothetical protein